MAQIYSGHMILVEDVEAQYLDQVKNLLMQREQ